MEVKTIGVLTSGGDAPGMNAAVRSVVRSALAKGMKVVGIKRGYNGLINNDVVEMDLRSVSDIIHRGGTILYTARSPEFKTEEGMSKALKTCKELGIDGCVVVGGDGSYRGARDLSLHGIPCVGIPGTIDNDISCTDYTIGFDSAMNTAMEMVDKLRDTAQSHERCTVVEVMGRHAGHLALQTGIAVGATAVLVPEVEFDINDVVAKMKKTQLSGKKHFIIVVAEGIGGVDEFTKKIEELTGIESRATVLGHVQRGGNPTVRDRVIASQMGFAAVELLSKGIGNRVVALRDSEIVDFDIYEALQMKKPFNMELYKIANEISI
ncbi:MAG: 6-phosphofructokinase [Clostridia bacterium]|nr:6-phosphofructokinase [Clostridia bacterium]